MSQKNFKPQISPHPHELCRFITLEGCDGFGKSTLARNLAERLQHLGAAVELTAEPGGTPLADKIRQLFALGSEKESWSVEGELMLVSAARSQHLKNRIIPALKQGKWVICDRFTDSTRVYQGWVGGCDEEHIERTIKLTTYGYTPGLTFLLDGDPTIIHPKRFTPSKKRSQPISRFDLQNLDFHQHIRQGFLHYARKYPRRFHILAATSSPENLLGSALKILKDYSKQEQVPLST